MKRWILFVEMEKMIQCYIEIGEHIIDLSFNFTGGQLRYLQIKKLATSPKCGDCHIALPGIPALRPREYSQISKRQKTVQRAYGGSRCATCVRDRIVRSFLVEEAKIVKKVSDSFLVYCCFCFSIFQRKQSQGRGEMLI